MNLEEWEYEQGAAQQYQATLYRLQSAEEMLQRRIKIGSPQEVVQRAMNEVAMYRGHLQQMQVSGQRYVDNTVIFQRAQKVIDAMSVVHYEDESEE